MSALPRVFLLANDVLPGSTLPVAAPGLRAFGLAAGLRANGCPAELVGVASGPRKLWRSSPPAPALPGTRYIREARLQEYFAANAPAVVVLTNSNQVEHLRSSDGIRYVFDFFAPKVLELLCQGEISPETAELAALRERKLRGLALADAVIVNGAKKVPYALGWLLQTGVDVARLPLEVVNMCVPIATSTARRAPGDVRLGIAGYLQPWSIPGPWFDGLGAVVERHSVRLQLLVSTHWGSRQQMVSERIEQLARHPRVSTHLPMTYASFCRFLEGLDVVVDLFDRSLEREYAMVTRTVVALARGLPVVHPPFTEVAPLIAEFDAGWLLDPVTPEVVQNTLEEIVKDPDAMVSKRANARRLAAEVLDPAVATGPLMRILSRLAATL